VNYGIGDKELHFLDCYSDQMDFVENELDELGEDAKAIGESIKKKINTFFPNYSECNALLDVSFF